MCVYTCYQTILHRKYRRLDNGYVLRHEKFLHDTVERKMLGKATRGRKWMELLHDMMEGRDYGQLKDLISDRSNPFHHRSLTIDTRTDFLG